MNEAYNKNSWNENEYKEFVNYLLSIGDEKFKQFHSNLVPGSDRIIGIKVPILRKLGSEIAKGNWREYFKICQDNYYEETMLQGFILDSLKISVDELMIYMDGFIEKIDNWATCDTFCCGLKIVKKNREAFFPYIEKLLLSEKPFTIRTGLILLLAHYINEQYIDKIFDISNKTKNENYYVKMANAWLIATCYVKQKEKTKVFLSACALDDWSYNKAIQKIIESKTTTAEEKCQLRKMKR